MTKKIAFLGMGVMGTPMSLNLMQAGFPVTVWNRSSSSPNLQRIRDSNGTVKDSIAAAVEDADYIFICVSDVPDVKEVLLGIKGAIHCAKPQALIIDFSTIGSPTARDIAEKLKAKHLRFLDAPISGGDIGAENGTLTIMVGGDRQDFEEAMPYFEAMGKNIYYCGETGSGQAVKMCNQVLCAVHMVALCEAIKLAEYQGIDPNLMIEVCQTGAAGSWAIANLGRKITMADFRPGFMIKHILKDLRLVQETLDNFPALPGFELATQQFKNTAQLADALEQGTQAMFRAYY
ncbi:NAD(P)-dependent oxidoreductase [[Limnothrix rosea] IAM M-220]|uniref:NAD(P)-dependent oxidoreductase n=1 Tax=[Limnothrix rosea] IAM M-220 TaxID=454133 RepID=UPI00095F6712|nr:NAD(P)-dependent oxidoreductase [[Limnothrix rosea] IAM M-220]OKH11886.1 oxidoreductase [[Limnothrix rosea] IAM M-220]